MTSAYTTDSTLVLFFYWLVCALPLIAFAIGQGVIWFSGGEVET